MAWPCYWTIAGTEVINAARTEKYAESAPWFVPVYKPHHLDEILGETYIDPQTDDAPWYDPDVPESKDFWGAYPLDVTGMDDSTRTSTPVESTLDGGSPGRLRHAIRAGVFSVALVGANEAAVSYGFSWLKAALLGSTCGPSGQATANCMGSQMCFYTADPGYSGSVCVPSDGIDNSDRYFRAVYWVVVNNGPTVTSRNNTSDGGVVWSATWTAVCGVPFAYGMEVPVVQGLFNPSVPDPAVGGGTYDDVGHSITDIDCAAADYQPVTDPLCPALVPPPLPPGIEIDCYTPPTTWTRRQFTIPADLLTEWSDAVIKVSLATTSLVRSLRLRFFADPDGTLNPDTDPCAFCAEMVISYIPGDGVMQIDGTVQVITFESAGGNSRRAEGLVFSTDGSPFTWPQLACGVQYVVTVDSDPAQVMPFLDLSILQRDA